MTTWRARQEDLRRGRCAGRLADQLASRHASQLRTQPRTNTKPRWISPLGVVLTTKPLADHGFPRRLPKCYGIRTTLCFGRSEQAPSPISRALACAIALTAGFEAAQVDSCRELLPSPIAPIPFDRVLPSRQHLVDQHSHEPALYIMNLYSSDDVQRSTAESPTTARARRSTSAGFRRPASTASINHDSNRPPSCANPVSRMR